MTDALEASAPAPHRRRVLLAEDDRELRTLIADALRGAGYDVTEAADGDQLIERLADTLKPDYTRGSFDLILSDIRMPTFSALDVLVGARRFIGRTPVVLLTAFGDAAVHDKALRRGAALVLDKPVRLSELFDAINRTLDANGARSDA